VLDEFHPQKMAVIALWRFDFMEMQCPLWVCTICFNLRLRDVCVSRTVIFCRKGRTANVCFLGSSTEQATRFVRDNPNLFLKTFLNSLKVPS